MPIHYPHAADPDPLIERAEEDEYHNRIAVMREEPLSYPDAFISEREQETDELDPE